MAPAQDTRRYRFDFALIVLTGNLTHYLTIRPQVDADPRVSARWFPIRTWVESDWIGWLPDALRVRARHLLDSWRFLLFTAADAQVVHAFETFTVAGLLHRLLRRRSILVCYFDGAVKNVPSPSSPGLRGVLHRVALEETALFIAWSEAAAASARRIYPPCAERLLVQHPGIDLSSWPHAAAHTNVGPLRLLFVGADVERKGLDTLLDAFEDELAPACTLDVVTPGAHLDPRLRSRMARMSGVTLHDDLRPGSDRLRALYRASGCLVLPTRAEGSPWVILEAMATGLPVVTTACGGVPEMVLQERTGLLVPPDQPSALAAAVRRLMDARLRRRLGTAARKHVERRFDARRNVPALLAAIETLVETRQPVSDLPRTSTQA